MSFSLWTDTEEHEVILPDSLEHLHDLSEIGYLYVQRKSCYCVKASGPSGEVKLEGKNDPDLELQTRLRLGFVEEFRYTELQDFSETLTRDRYPDWISKLFDRSRNLKTLMIDSCGLAVTKYIFRFLSSTRSHRCFFVVSPFRVQPSPPSS